MRLFHFGKKKDKMDEPEKSVVSAEEIREKQKSEAVRKKYTNDDNRRFVMLVEETFLSQQEDGIVTVGWVQGTIKNGDAVCLLEPGGQVNMVNVVGLAVQENGDRKPVEEASDQVAGVKIYDINGRKRVAKFAVLTSVRPESDAKAPTGIENPYVWGLSYGYLKFGNQKEYSDILLAELFRAYFLAAVYMKNPKGEEREDGGLTLTKDLVIEFPGLKKQGEEDIADFAVFTDWIELGRWKNVFDENHPPKTMVLRFTDCLEMAGAKNNQKMSGIVINAFGKNPILLSSEQIERIRHSEEYQQALEQQKLKKNEHSSNNR